MALITPGKPDRCHIKMNSEAELRYWLKHLRVTRDELQQVVDKVGDNAATVRKYLRTEFRSAASSRRTPAHDRDTTA
jgi:hypothetical protein